MKILLLLLGAVLRATAESQNHIGRDDIADFVSTMTHFLELYGRQETSPASTSLISTSTTSPLGTAVGTVQPRSTPFIFDDHYENITSEYYCSYYDSADMELGNREIRMADAEKAASAVCLEWSKGNYTIAPGVPQSYAWHSEYGIIDMIVSHINGTQYYFERELSDCRKQFTSILLHCCHTKGKDDLTCDGETHYGGVKRTSRLKKDEVSIEFKVRSRRRLDWEVPPLWSADYHCYPHEEEKRGNNINETAARRYMDDFCNRLAEHTNGALNTTLFWPKSYLQIPYSGMNFTVYGMGAIPGYSLDPDPRCTGGISTTAYTEICRSGYNKLIDRCRWTGTAGDALFPGGKVHHGCLDWLIFKTPNQ